MERQPIHSSWEHNKAHHRSICNNSMPCTAFPPAMSCTLTWERRRQHCCKRHRLPWLRRRAFCSSRKRGHWIYTSQFQVGPRCHHFGLAVYTGSSSSGHRLAKIIRRIVDDCQWAGTVQRRRCSVLVVRRLRDWLSSSFLQSVYRGSHFQCWEWHVPTRTQWNWKQSNLLPRPTADTETANEMAQCGEKDCGLISVCTIVSVSLWWKRSRWYDKIERKESTHKWWETLQTQLIRRLTTT